MSGYSFLNDQLSKRTSIFGLHLWVVLGICVRAAIVLILFLISLWFTSRRNSSSSSKAMTFTHNSSAIPNVSKEIQEIRIDDFRNNLSQADPKPINHQSHPDPVADSDSARAQPLLLKQDDHHDSPAGSGGRQRIHIEIGKDHQISYPEKGRRRWVVVVSLAILVVVTSFVLIISLTIVLLLITYAVVGLALTLELHPGLASA